MLPVRNKLVNPEAQNVPDVNAKNDFDRAVEDATNAINLAEAGIMRNPPSEFALKMQENLKATVNKEIQKHLGEDREVTGIDKITKEVVKIKKKQVNNTEQFLEELHKLIESWGPQSTNWEGDKRIILYDWECREEIRKLMIKYGL